MTKKVTLAAATAGHAEGGTALNAFDNALLAAGIGNINLIKISSILPPDVPVIELRRDEKVEPMTLERTDSYQLEVENVSDAIRGEAEPLLGREDALGQARALEALHESATNGRSVSL